MGIPNVNNLISSIVNVVKSQLCVHLIVQIEVDS